MYIYMYIGMCIYVCIYVCVYIYIYVISTHMQLDVQFLFAHSEDYFPFYSDKSKA